MSIMLADTYATLKEAGASGEAAKAAAEEIAAFESRLATVAPDLKLVKWMLGTNLVVSTGVLIRLLLGQVAGRVREPKGKGDANQNDFSRERRGVPFVIWN